MKLNKNGMTLIETIVGILILSIASLMAATGFSTIIQQMEEGAEIKNATNRIVNAIDGNKNDTDTKNYISSGSATAILTVQKNGSSKQVKNSGQLVTGEISYGDGINDNVSISRYISRASEISESEKKADDMLHDDFIATITPEFINSLTNAEKGEIRATCGMTSGPNYGNSSLREYLQCMAYKNEDGSYNWPALDMSKLYYYYTDANGVQMKKYMDTFLDKDNMHIFPYYPSVPGSSNALGYYIVYAFNSEKAENNWGAFMVYNDTDQHWYFIEDSRWGMKIKSFGLTSINKTTIALSKEEWDRQKQDMMQESLFKETSTSSTIEKIRWRRVYEDK